MKKVALIVGAMLVLGAGAALAQAPGLNMAWDDCIEAGGVQSRTVTCTNSATVINRLACSFLVPQTIPELAASDGIVDFQVDSPTLPAWWNPSATRYGPGIGGSSCFDIWLQDPVNPAVMSFTFVPGQAPNRVRVRTAISFTAPFTFPADPGIEYGNHNILLRYNAGTFNNPGCLTPACIVFNQLDLLQPGTLPKTTLASPATSAHATWRTPSAATPCPAATPAKKATWGSIKALYR
jgi:hypothetical protein